jgi:hypothetical protein
VWPHVMILTRGRHERLFKIHAAGAIPLYCFVFPTSLSDSAPDAACAVRQPTPFRRGLNAIKGRLFSGEATRHTGQLYCYRQ